MSTASPTAPQSSRDLFSAEALANPYPIYDELREAGPAVWLTGLNAYAFTRYAESRDALRNWEVFSSASGVALSDAVNQATAGNSSLTNDPPKHDAMRRLVRRPLTANALRELTPRLTAEADELVAGLVERGTFDAVKDLAQHLPLAVISNLVGIPEAGRERMLDWATATFDAMGPDNARTKAAFPVVMEMNDYALTQAIPPHLAPGGWAQLLYDNAKPDEIEMCSHLMPAYLAPSLDTTINGTGSAIHLLGQHPNQWELLRREPSYLSNAVNEALRLESPIQYFSRCTTQDRLVGDTNIPAGSRVVLFFGAANRDHRRWADPTQFDVRRDRAAEHLAFGFGPHACVGSGLARLEMRVVLEALAKRVKSFTIGPPVRATNQCLRGLVSLEVTITATA